MSYRYSVKERHIRKDKWVREIIRSHNVDLLSDLIKKRIEFPGTTGPTISHFQDETSTDIIEALIEDDDEFRRKIAPAVGLLLYKLMLGKIGESHEILRGVFSIINGSRLTECNDLLYKWLQQNANHLVSDDIRHRMTYREGMMAFARVQRTSKLTEVWWENIWKEGRSYFWTASFYGLMLQNATIAASHLKLLMSRNPDKLGFLLVGMWHNSNSQSAFELSIKQGLETNEGWAGRMLNILLEKLAEKDKDKIVNNLRNISIS